MGWLEKIMAKDVFLFECILVYLHVRLREFFFFVVIFASSLTFESMF